MRVLFVLEDKGEAKALVDLASELGLSPRTCESLIEGEGLLKEHAFDAIVLRRGKGSIALRSFLRTAASNAPSAKLFVLGGQQSAGSGGDDTQVRALSAATGVELLAEAPPTEIIVRVIGAKLGKAPAVLGYEVVTPIDHRRSWTASLANDRATGERGVLATLDPRIALDELALDELGRELPPAVAVKHPSLAVASRIALEPPVPLVFWSVPPGLPLSALFQAERDRKPPSPLPLGGALGVMVQLAGALRALHEASVVHGAIEPWAVWACKDGGVRLIHQGFAAFAEAERRRTRDRRSTSPFPEDGLPPEKALDDRGATPAGDVYGAGIVLYELLCGERPFRRGSSSETLQAILSDAPVPPDARRPDVPAPLSALVVSMLAKAPEDRPKDGATLEAALLALMPKSGGWRRLLGSSAKPEELVAEMMRERAKGVKGFR
jgi:hypothetical protein